MENYAATLYSTQKVFEWGADHEPDTTMATPPQLETMRTATGQITCVVIPTSEPHWATARDYRTEIMLWNGDLTSRPSERFALVHTEIHSHKAATRDLRWFSSIAEIATMAADSATHADKFAVQELRTAEWGIMAAYWKSVAVFAAELAVDMAEVETED